MHTILRFIQKSDKNFVEIPLGQPGRLYVSPMPFGPYDCHRSILPAYRVHKVKHVTILVTEEEIRNKAKKDIFEEYRNSNINSIHFPIPDLTCPFLEPLAELTKRMVELLANKENIAIHCNAGVGRTCLVASCVTSYMRNCPSAEAYAFVKSHTHVDLTTQQKLMIQRFAKLVGSESQETARIA